MASRWAADATRYELDWGGRRWSLLVDAPRTGLTAGQGMLGPLLAVDGISARGRLDPSTLGGASLVGHETLFNRVESLYAPEGWGTLRVRASWDARAENVVDLAVQIQAFTVGDLEAVEVHVTSRLGVGDVEEMSGLDSAALARLREADVTLPIRTDAPFPPLLAKVGQADGASSYYLEMIHPDDATRREVGRASGEVRYALFGHDLERGVVVRGRLRGIWFDRRPDEAEVSHRLEQFLREPPPLGT